MSASIDYPAVLAQMEFVRLRVRLEYQQDALLPPGHALRLRRELRPVAQQLLSAEDYAALFERPLPSDPQLLRLVQRPSPGFALQPQLTMTELRVSEGDEEELLVNFFGSACTLIPQFVATLAALGAGGISHGAGPYEILAVASADQQGTWQTVWRRGRPYTTLAPVLLDAAGWLESNAPVANRARLQWLTPLRLISAGRPLFQVDFAKLCPFLLRRVTSMAATYCDLEGWVEPAALFAAAHSLHSDNRGLRWEDWRVLQGAEERHELGGLRGEMTVAGPAVERLAWLLQLAALMNLGKGAAYGCGHFSVTFVG